jgi:dual specificity tyrosine-phosphorylation-regulated kinase 2/3/4
MLKEINAERIETFNQKKAEMDGNDPANGEF